VINEWFLSSAQSIKFSVQQNLFFTITLLETKHPNFRANFPISPLISESLENRDILLVVHIITVRKIHGDDNVDDDHVVIAACHSRVQPNHWSWSLDVIEGGAIKPLYHLSTLGKPAEEKTVTKYSSWSLTYPARSSTADDPDGSVRRRDPLSMHGRFS